MNFDPAALLQLLHCKSATDALHLALEVTGGAVLIWQFLATLIPKAALWLVPMATRAAAAFALFLLANPIAGPILRANKDKIVPLLRQLLDLVDKVAGAFEQELEKDIAAEPPPAPSPATALAAAGGLPDGPKVPTAPDGGAKPEAGAAAPPAAN